MTEVKMLQLEDGIGSPKSFDLCIFISDGVSAHVRNRALTKQRLVLLAKNISRLLVYHSNSLPLTAGWVGGI